MKTYYELLELTGSATFEDIKRNFRREIAKYHPDKVQHLGEEFQEIAAVKAAELTQAYKTLSDETLRAEYDELLRTGGEPDAAARPAGPPAGDAARDARAGGPGGAPRPRVASRAVPDAEQLRVPAGARRRLGSDLQGDAHSLSPGPRVRVRDVRGAAGRTASRSPACRSRRSGS